MKTYIRLDMLVEKMNELGVEWNYDGIPKIEYPPCNIGDTIYTAFLDKVMQYTVNEIKITTSGTYLGLIGDFEKEFRISVENLGKTFFLTYEKAEEQLVREKGE